MTDERMKSQLIGVHLGILYLCCLINHINIPCLPVSSVVTTGVRYIDTSRGGILGWLSEINWERGCPVSPSHS